MELKEAIEHLKDQCKFGLSRLFTENDILAIDTVLEELNNRIPREYIENILENLSEGEYILNENGEISGRRYENRAIHYLQKLLNKE